MALMVEGPLGLVELVTFPGRDQSTPPCPLGWPFAGGHCAAPARHGSGGKGQGTAHWCRLLRCLHEPRLVG